MQFQDHLKRVALTRSANTVQVRFPKLGEIKIDHHIHSLNVNTSCEKIWTE